MSNLPSYPREAAERETAMGTEDALRELSGWWRRVGASVLDSLLLIVPLIVVFAIVLASNPDDDSGAWGVLVLAYFVTFLLPFVYYTVMHGGRRGQTFGKRALGIRVVTDEGGSIGYGRAFGRYLITFLFGVFVLPAVLDSLWPLWDPKKQALHDKVVGSLVVRA